MQCAAKSVCKSAERRERVRVRVRVRESELVCVCARAYETVRLSVVLIYVPPLAAGSCLV